MPYHPHTRGKFLLHSSVCIPRHPRSRARFVPLGAGDTTRDSRRQRTNPIPPRRKFNSRWRKKILLGHSTASPAESLSQRISFWQSSQFLMEPCWALRTWTRRESDHVRQRRRSLRFRGACCPGISGLSFILPDSKQSRSTGHPVKVIVSGRRSCAWPDWWLATIRQV